MSKIFICVCILLINLSSFSQKAFLQNPIQGTYLKDYFIVNYVDWRDTGILDYQCGTKTYDGHQGTDFVLRNFRQMDSGVLVIAAADGIVTSTVDSLFDRNKEAVSGHLGNYIAIRHSNKFYTYYAHLRKGSLIVHPGDSVVAGQAMALVGSSGYSSDPHLHFELWYDSLYLVDPFSGPCGNNKSLWIAPKPYINTFGIIDHDFCNSYASTDDLKERITSQKLFTIKDDTVNFWVEAYGLRKDDISTFNWYTPQNNFWFTYSYTHPTDLWYYYFETYIFRPAVTMPGLWRLEYLVNNNLKVSDYFEIGTTTNTEQKSNSDSIYISESGVIQFKNSIPIKSKIKLYNSSAQLLFQSFIPSGEQKYILPIYSEIKNGMYIIQILNSNSSISLKFIK